MSGNETLYPSRARMGRAMGGRLSSRSFGNAVQVGAHEKAATQASTTRLNRAISMAEACDVSTLSGVVKRVA